MIETRPEVFVDAHSRWMFQGNEVTHEGVLAYFKANLYLEDGGYFILNRHGDRVEKAHISVLNFPLFALSLAASPDGVLTLLLDTKEQVQIAERDLFVYGEDVLFFFHPERGAAVRLRASAMMHAMNEIEESNGQLCWKSGLPVSRFSGELFQRA